MRRITTDICVFIQSGLVISMRANSASMAPIATSDVALKREHRRLDTLGW
jgi:hypothetical protein